MEKFDVHAAYKALPPVEKGKAFIRSLLDHANLTDKESERLSEQDKLLKRHQGSRYLHETLPKRDVFEADLRQLIEDKEKYKRLKADLPAVAQELLLKAYLNLEEPVLMSWQDLDPVTKAAIEDARKTLAEKSKPEEIVVAPVKPTEQADVASEGMVPVRVPPLQDTVSGQAHWQGPAEAHLVADQVVDTPDSTPILTPEESPTASPANSRPSSPSPDLSFPRPSASVDAKKKSSL